MRTFACVVMIDIDDVSELELLHDRARWSMALSVGVRDVTMYDVTDELIERIRLTADGPEEV